MHQCRRGTSAARRLRKFNFRSLQISKLLIWRLKDVTSCITVIAALKTSCMGHDADTITFYYVVHIWYPIT